MFLQLWRAWHFLGVDRRIRRHGWTAIYVGDYQTAPTWAYTVGFDESLNLPEVVVFDIPQADANALFWQVFNELKDGSLVLEDGKVWPEGLEHRPVWRKVHPSRIGNEENWFGFAVQRRARRIARPFGLEVFQLVLPDNDGQLPWEDDYDDRLRPRQPALYEPFQAGASQLAANDRV